MRSQSVHLDVEGLNRRKRRASRARTTRRILAFLAIGTRAARLPVAAVREAHPEIVKEIAAADRGGCSGLHSYRTQRRSPKPTPTHSGERSADARSFMQDIIRPTRAGSAPRVLPRRVERMGARRARELGLGYSSSVLPASQYALLAFRAPAHSAPWASEVLEMPCPVNDVGPITNPDIGGIYIRGLPWTAVKYGLARAIPTSPMRPKAHPDDLDTGSPFRKRPESRNRGSHGLQWDQPPAQC